MKPLVYIFTRIQTILKGASRYVVATVFFMCAAVVNMDSIINEKEHTKVMLALLTGAFIGAVAQMIWERFFKSTRSRIIILLSSVVITFLYYLILESGPDRGLEIIVRTMAIMLGLFILFLWIPVIKSRYDFNDSFMIGFKSIFISILYGGVLFLGLMLVYGAVELLITDVDEKLYMHTANIVFVVFSPLVFLSKIPMYSDDEHVVRFSKCPDFLEVLISYIIIPLSVAYTFILGLYILINIKGDFWTNNLLEPLLVSYTIVIIIVYILASKLEKSIVVIFRRVYPKVLVPIVLFQIIASILLIGTKGITHGRYYVILFGVFAVVSGIVMSIYNNRKNGIIAGVLVVFSFISVIPPIDAFTISRISQESFFENVLNDNGMIVNGHVVKNSDISDNDKEKIINISRYLYSMDYIKDLEFMPDDFDYYSDFYSVFGFNEYEIKDLRQENIYLYYPGEDAVDIKGFDYYIEANIESQSESRILFTKESENGKYILGINKVGTIYLNNEEGNKILEFSLQDIRDRLSEITMEKQLLTKEEAVFIYSKDGCELKVIIKEYNQGENYVFAHCIVLVHISE